MMANNSLTICPSIFATAVRGSAALNGMFANREMEPQAAYLVEAEPRAARPGTGPFSVTAKV